MWAEAAAQLQGCAAGGALHREPRRRRSPHRPPDRRTLRTCHYLPIIRIVNEPGIAGACPPRPPAGGGAGAGPRSWLIVKIRLVLLSKVIVLAPFIVSM